VSRLDCRLIRRDVAGTLWNFDAVIRLTLPAGHRLRPTWREAFGLRDQRPVAFNPCAARGFEKRTAAPDLGGHRKWFRRSAAGL